ncbi:MAG: hypothetical protein LBE05_05925 [Microbacterium sp.]|jgi:hypothetical protein|nr:hypothetical protein [Microbacterium sp.]
MTVQLHYYGSVFDLDPEIPDEEWVKLHDEATDIQMDRERRILHVRLAGGKSAVIPLLPGAPLVLVCPQEAAPWTLNDTGIAIFNR